MAIRNRIVDHITVKGKDLQDNQGNWRVHPQMQRDALNGILAEVGIVDELIVYESERQGGLTILDGHLRAGEHPDVEWPCTVLDLTDEEADLVLATFDPLAGMAEMGARAMEALLDRVRPGVAEPSVLDMLDGLAEQAELALAEIEIVETGEAPEPQMDKGAELAEHYGVQVGQVWALGEHRLAVGDCTDKAVVDAVMRGEKVQLLFTSPPYAQQRVYSDADISDWDELMQGAFVIAPMTEDGQILVNLGLVHHDGEWQPYWQDWIDWMRGQGWRRFGWYVWDQGHGLRGDWNGRLAPSFEFIFHFNQQSVKPQKWIEAKHAGERGGVLRNPDGGFSDVTDPIIQSYKIPDSTIRVERQKGGIEGHPAPFSIELAEYIIKSWLGIVYDCFSGSGTTIIACERLGRKCRAIEIEPKYCAVTIQRWVDLMGLEPKLLQ